MTPQDMEARIVRYGDLVPCKTAFIDAHTPGSDQKENFTIIGGGVSESPDQHVHISIPHGFNIGAAGQPPKCRNSLHSHRTAEVFFVLKGRWRFFWGRHGDAGEVVLEEGDLINLPTGIFRGFENIGETYGMIMAILGGDDAGGGVIWAPEVIEDAKDHGLVLGENGRLYDSKKGECPPKGVAPMPVLSEEELKAYPELPTSLLENKFVARYGDMMAAVTKDPAKVLGKAGMLRDRPGFEVMLLNHGCATSELRSHDAPSVLMPMRGDWNVFWNAEGQDHNVTLNAGDTMSMPEHVLHCALPVGAGDASLFHIVATGDKAGATWMNLG